MGARPSSFIRPRPSSQASNSDPCRVAAGRVPVRLPGAAGAAAPPRRPGFAGRDGSTGRDGSSVPSGTAVTVPSANCRLETLRRRRRRRAADGEPGGVAHQHVAPVEHRAVAEGAEQARRDRRAGRGAARCRAHPPGRGAPTGRAAGRFGAPAAPGPVPGWPRARRRGVARAGSGPRPCAGHRCAGRGAAGGRSAPAARVRWRGPRRASAGPSGRAGAGAARGGGSRPPPAPGRGAPRRGRAAGAWPPAGRRRSARRARERAGRSGRGRSGARPLPAAGRQVRHRGDQVGADRHRHLGGARRGRRAAIRDVVDQRGVGLVPHRRDQRDRAREGGADDALLVEGPEILDGAAAAGHDEHVRARDRAPGREALKPRIAAATSSAAPSP